MRSQSSNKHNCGGPLRFHGMAWLATLVLPVMLTTVCVLRNRKPLWRSSLDHTV